MRSRSLRRHRVMLLIGVMAMVMAACSSESSTTTDVLIRSGAPDVVVIDSVAAPETTVPTEPIVEFDGESCTYSGPSEFAVGTLPRFEARNTGSVDFGVVMLQIDAGLSYQEVVARAGGFRGNRPDLPEGIQAGNGSGIMGPGEEQGFNVGFSASGNYLPACERWPDHTYFLAEGFVIVP